MKPLSDSLTEYTLQRPLTEYDRRFLGAMAQGYPIHKARQVDGVKKGISPSYAQIYSKQLLVKCNIDIRQLPDVNPAAWCYENAYFIQSRIGRRYIDLHPHNDAKPNRQDKDFCLAALKMALDGKNRPQIREALGSSINNVNQVMTGLRRLLVDCYLTGEEKDLEHEFWCMWARFLGRIRTKDVLQAVRSDWRTHERLGPLYKRKSKELSIM